MLEALRCRVSSAWARRQSLTPSYTLRRKPPALEIYKRLPGTNCRQCGEMTCMAFALRLWNGDALNSDSCILNTWRNDLRFSRRNT